MYNYVLVSANHFVTDVAFYYNVDAHNEHDFILPGLAGSSSRGGAWHVCKQRCPLRFVFCKHIMLERQQAVDSTPQSPRPTLSQEKKKNTKCH